MKQISISVTDPQYERLLQRAHKLGISVGELIRRILDKDENEE